MLEKLSFRRTERNMPHRVVENAPDSMIQPGQLKALIFGDLTTDSEDGMIAEDAEDQTSLEAPVCLPRQPAYVYQNSD